MIFSVLAVFSLVDFALNLPNPASLRKKKLSMMSL
jgi:hypothetical protein